MILVLYASQTGNSQFIAREITRRFTGRRNERISAISMDEFDLSTINQYEFVIFVVSTHGEGSSPYSGVKIYDQLKELHQMIKSRDQTDNVVDKNIFRFQFCTLGLGDSSYAHFCKFATDLHRLLISLGAKSHCEKPTLADSMDPNGFYDGLEKFIKTHSDVLVERSDAESYEPEEILSYVSVIPTYLATVMPNRCLNPQDPLPLYELILDVPELTEFVPGDCLGIIPTNSIDYDLLTRHFLPETVEFLLQYDLFSKPHWGIFKELQMILLQQNNNTKSLFSDKLGEISTDYDLYYEYVIDNKKNLTDILFDFKIKNITLSQTKRITRYLNRINTRYYSFSRIRSDITTEPEKYYFSILYNTLPKNKGLCSSYMRSITENCSIQVLSTNSRLFLNDKKLLFFCTGTGFTLPRSLIEEKAADYEKIIVYYGHRNEADCLCKTFVAGIPENVEIRCVKSREEGKYIQDKFIEDWEELKHILLHPTNNSEDILQIGKEWLVFVSGNSRNVKEIKKMFKKLNITGITIQTETW